MKACLDDKDTKRCPSFIDIRNQIITPDKELSEENMWQSEIPYDTRQLAIKNIVTAYKAAFKNKKNGNIQKFNIQFLSRKANKHYFNVDARAIDTKEFKVFKRRLKKQSKLRMRKRERRKINIDNKVCDSVITYKNGKWYLCLVQHHNPESVKQSCNFVALDPGVRTFQSFYSPDGVCGKLGNGFMDNIDKYHKRIDQLESIRAKKSAKLRKRCLTLRTKVRNIVSDLHNKSCNLLCRSFKTILLPEFQTQKMAKRENRNIQDKTVRRMMCLRHYDFKMKLIHYGASHNCDVHIVNEHFTSKVCGRCGTENEIGSSEIFRCQSCNLSIDRDIHAARNICLKNCAYAHPSMVHGG